MSNDQPKPKPAPQKNKTLGTPNWPSHAKPLVATPQQRLAILRLFEAAAPQTVPNDHGPGLYPSAVHTLPGLSAFAPDDKAIIQEFILAEERAGFLTPAGPGHGRTPSGLKFNVATGPDEIKRLEALVKAAAASQ